MIKNGSSDCVHQTQKKWILLQSCSSSSLHPPRKAKRSGSNIFALFSQKQIQEFKEAFGIMDTDKDGIITASDLKNAFTAVGKSISDGDASSMLSEAPGPVNFTQLVTLFAEKMAGGEKKWKTENENEIWKIIKIIKCGTISRFLSGTDDDDVILKSFEAFEVSGKIDAEM